MSDATTGTRNVIIIGSGPAGYTAAVYAARASLDLDGTCRPAVRDGVADQIGEDLLEAVGVPRPARGRAPKVDAGVRVSRPELVYRRAEDATQICRPRIHLDAA